MAKMKKSEQSGSHASFEDALADLQQIVADLEDGALGLEESLARFEKGIGLLRQCYETLEKAEQRIQIVTGLDADGRPLTAPFDASATVEQTNQAAGKRRSRKKAAEAPPAPAEPSGDEDDDEDRMLF